jgi:glycosyltransferase involved in cell wall biosynthesis
MKPLVSIIIPNYNYADYVGEAIDSALNQTYENLEVIVVDDGSKDDSPDILKNYGNKINAIFQKNAGVSAARNNGVKHSTGEYIAFLDADDAWLPEKIQKQVELFEKDKSLGLVHVGVEDIDADGNVIDTILDGLSGSVSHEFLLFEQAVVLGGGSGMMIPRKVFDETGGFDTELMTSADWDICYRICRRFEIGFVPKVLLKYRIHGSNMHGNIPRMEREMLYAYEKAFKDKAEDIQNLKRKAYGNLHQILAGSYFRAGQYSNFARHTLKSIYLKPSNFLYFVKFPIRRLKRS